MVISRNLVTNPLIVASFITIGTTTSWANSAWSTTKAYNNSSSLNFTVPGQIQSAKVFTFRGRQAPLNH
ncbi:hypothetical protein [Merismopedia glauca]|uniref:Uncharacterized protein n=1 Tax=Merismopedia glauca CCAP 1448/3 TaxID=1296344 RepID=A0A2T1BYF2_9CYAN|nr:hypothetical protein C7B64_20910 [Merismopedia glauca CCAP 1448/3]